MKIRKTTQTLYPGGLCKKKKTCMYAITTTNKMWICDYIGAAGISRNCPADNCDKFTPWGEDALEQRKKMMKIRAAISRISC